MKRKLLSALAVILSMTAFAQTAEIENAVVLDWAEDTTEVTSVNDIINVQELVTTRNSSAAHFNKVWSRNSYFNMSYTDRKLTPIDKIPLGGININGGYAPEFKSDWGAGIQLGHNYGLHKKPIANLVKINLDITYLDLNVNHFKAENATYLYDSSKTFTAKDKEDKDQQYYYTPWCLQKYEANITMWIGPSITIAPFTYIKVPQLQFFKINVYYHFGYQASILWMQNDEKKNANQQPENDYSYNRDPVDSSLKMDWAHGLTKAFGVSLSWKSIGVGYETQTSKLDYVAMDSDLFSREKYKFDASSTRLYLQIKF